ncbi:response regulator [Candidatus Nitrospira bockiana]
MDRGSIVVAVSDVFFYTKIRDAFRDGYQLERARTPGEIVQKVSTLSPAALIVNLNDERLEPFQALTELQQTPGRQPLPVLAFANHEEVDTWRRAKELGVAKVVSRNEFSARTRGLVEEILGQPSVAGDPGARPDR